ncbi:MAG TPA: hypothetical protein VNU71_10230, partial [Burkholderiaceae bacterium]|nr:hypothetical protein [Burkholderiaceae bacterium]
MTEPIEAPHETPPPAPPPRWSRALRWSGVAALGLAAAAAVYISVLVQTTPGVDELRRAQAVRPSVILSSDGEVIGRFSTLYQAPVTLREVPKDLINAL